MSGKDITTNLQYETKTFDRPFFYGRPKLESDKHESFYGGTQKSVEVIVKDARELGMSLDKHSFELFDHVTTLKTEDFYNADKVVEIYYEEVKELLKKVTGAKDVKIFHHQVRNDAKRDNQDPTEINTPVQGYAHGIHSDSSRFSAEDLFKMLTSDAEYQKGRFLYLNVWRNISEVPIMKDPLTVLDQTSLISPEDFIESEIYTAGGNESLQYRLNAVNASKHKWYYFSEMKKNEALLFKQYDSDTELTGRTCFHTAFHNPMAPQDAPVRESIEVRALCYFPDHTPNTCPELSGTTALENKYTGDQVLDKSIKKILQAAKALNTWPQEALVWVKMEFSKGRTGIETIARTLVSDKTGYFGTKNLPEETKEKIYELLMTEANFEDALKDGYDKAKNRIKATSITVSIQTTTLISLVSVALGFSLCLLFKTKF